MIDIQESSSTLLYLKPNDTQSAWIQFIKHIYSQHTEYNLDYRSVENLTIDDIPLASIDFHCTNIV